MAAAPIVRVINLATKEIRPDSAFGLIVPEAIELSPIGFIAHEEAKPNGLVLVENALDISDSLRFPGTTCGDLDRRNLSDRNPWCGGNAAEGRTSALSTGAEELRVVVRPRNRIPHRGIERGQISQPSSKAATLRGVAGVDELHGEAVMHTILHIVGYLHHPSARPLPAVPAVPLVSLRRNVWQAGKQTQGGGKVFGKVLFNGNLRRPEMIEHQLLLLFGAKVHQGMWRWHGSCILCEVDHQAD